MENLLNHSIDKLENWVSSQRYMSYDSHDFQATKLGILSKNLYNNNNIFKYPVFGLLYLVDIFFPASRILFSKKELSSEALPYFVRGYFRLYELSKKTIYLEKALYCLNLLTHMSIKTDSGIGWGLHFDWPTLTFIPKNTPCVTITSNVIDGFLKGYQVTKDKTYLEIIKKASDFVRHDLNRKFINEDVLAVSYTPLCNLFAINANSFSARMLYDVSLLFSDDGYLDVAEKILRYVLQQQNEDGSWFYRDKDDRQNNFIDNLHTCFVLEHLYSIFMKNHDQKVKTALEKGYNFFINTFVNNDYSCKHFYVYPNPTGVKVDIRSCAESIFCCALLSPLFPPGLDLAKRIAYWTIQNMQDSKGYFHFRIYSVFKNKMPYMRWGEAPMFNALTYLLKKIAG